MTNGSNLPDDKDLDRWLARLAGDEDADDPVAERLRDTISKQQRRHEDEIDELRLRRGRKRLVEALKARQADEAPRRTAGPWAIAASIAVIATAGLIGYQQFIAGPPSIEPGVIMSFGDLERPRGEVPTVMTDFDDPLVTGKQLGRQLTDAGVPFELRQGDDGILRLAVSLSTMDDVALLRDVLGNAGADIVGPGYYVIVIE